MRNCRSTLIIIFIQCFCLLRAGAVPVLSSLPGASAVIFFDFDGQSVSNAAWNSGVPFDCAAAALTDAQITETFNRVAEDYRPFNVNITTDSTKYFSAPAAKRIRIIVTASSSAWTGSTVDGATFIGSFSWGDDTPGFVFTANIGYITKNVAERCAHEAGHTLGLDDQAQYNGACVLTNPLDPGSGTDQLSWAPIMGNSYNKTMSGWRKGPTPFDCATLQDELDIIATQNGFGYRADDYPDDINLLPPAILPLVDPVVGLISTSTDKDFTAVILPQGTVHLEIKPYSIAGNDGANLDIKLRLYNASKTLINTYDPADRINVTIDSAVNAGLYYLEISGAGNANLNSYGSLGSYTISGLVVLPVHAIVLSGRKENKDHQLHWNISADEAPQSVTLQYSFDGTYFTDLKGFNNSVSDFSYLPAANTGHICYRLKVQAVSNILYSNTVILETDDDAGNLFAVVSSPKQVRVQCAENFEYRLISTTGAVLLHRNGYRDCLIDLGIYAPGMYVLWLGCKAGSRTVKIIKE